MTAAGFQGTGWRRMAVDYAGLLAVLAGLTAVFALTADNFLTMQTFRMMANQIPPAIILAAGMTYVLVIGGIDLSVGSLLALSGAALGVAMVQWGWPLFPAMLLCLGVGAACGLANGLVSSLWALPSFIVTLGMLEAARGGAYLATNSQTMYIGASIERVSETHFLGFSVPFLVALGVVAAGQIMLRHTVFGRYMMAIGANEEVVRLSGVNPRPIKVAVFVLCGFHAGLAAVIQCSRLGSADPNAGAGVELQAIAAVVIGGTSLMGGRGSVVRSFFGVLVISVLAVGLAQIGAQEPTKRLITGLVIVAAVIFDLYRERLGRRAA